MTTVGEHRWVRVERSHGRWRSTCECGQVCGDGVSLADAHREWWTHLDAAGGDVPADLRRAALEKLRHWHDGRYSEALEAFYPDTEPIL